MQREGYESQLLWQGHGVMHVFHDKIPSVQNFYVVEDAILFDGYYCATNYKNAARLITSIQAEFK